MKRYLMLLVFIICFSVVGCASNNTEENIKNKASAEGMIDIYVPQQYDIKKSDERYQIKQPDSVTASLEEVLAALKKSYDGKIVSYKYDIDENNKVVLEVKLDNDYSKEQNMLFMVAVSDTIFQIVDIVSIDIAISGTETGEVIENHINRSTFYLYDYPKDYGFKAVTVELFKPDESGEKLMKSVVGLYSEQNVSLCETIIAYMAESGYIPTKTKLNSVSISNRTCYLDFSKEFEDTIPNVKSSAIVYSVVNTLTNLSNIDKVVFLIDGSLLGTYKQTIDTSYPLEFNQDILK